MRSNNLLFTTLNRKVVYGNCSQLDKLQSAARQAVREIKQLEKQLAESKVREEELVDGIAELTDCFALLASDEGSCKATGYFDYNHAMELLCKHKSVQ
jgi:hypothetical protein